MGKEQKPKSNKIYTFWWAVRLVPDKPEEVISIEVEADSEESALHLASEQVVAKNPVYHYYTNKFQVTKAVK